MSWKSYVRAIQLVPYRSSAPGRPDDTLSEKDIILKEIVSEKVNRLKKVLNFFGGHFKGEVETPSKSKALEYYSQVVKYLATEPSTQLKDCDMSTIGHPKTIWILEDFYKDADARFGKFATIEHEHPLFDVKEENIYVSLIKMGKVYRRQLNMTDFTLDESAEEVTMIYNGNVYNHNFELVEQTEPHPQVIKHTFTYGRSSHDKHNYKLIVNPTDEEVAINQQFLQSIQSAVELAQSLTESKL